MNPYAEINFADELKIRFFKFYFIFLEKGTQIIFSILYTKVKKFMIIARAPRLEPEACRGFLGAKAIRDFFTVVYILFFPLLDTLKPFRIIIIIYSILYLGEWSMRSSKPWVAL
jgi:hypothetical protein